MFNVVFLIWYFLTLAIMIIGVLIFKFFADIKELKKLNKEIAFLEKKLKILNDEKREMDKMNKILNETIFLLKK